jgi:drug/metabolite transporter (DMT)-like permease
MRITALIYAAVVGTFAAHLLNIYINQKYGATTISLTTYIIPIVSNIGGVALLGEQITWVTVLGMALIIGGIFVMNNVLGDNDTG